MHNSFLVPFKAETNLSLLMMLFNKQNDIVKIFYIINVTFTKYSELHIF